MPVTNSELFTLAHVITKSKNLAYFGGYRKAFAAVMRELYKHGRPVRGFEIKEPKRLWA